MSYEKAEVPAMPWTGGPLPRPELLTVAPSPISLLSAFRRRWVLATFLGVLMGGLLALGPYFAVPVRYTVGTLLKVAEVEPYILAGKRGGPDEFDRYKSAEAQRILAIDVMTYALRDSNVNSLPILPKANPVEFLQKNISVSYPGNSTLMRISMKGKDPEQLKVIVNAVREAYLTQVIEDRRQKKLDDLANKEKYLKDLSDEADRQRDMIHNLLTNLQSTPQLLVQQAKMYAEKLSSLHREQMGKRETIRKLGHEVAMATAALEEAEKQDPTVLEDVVEQALMQQDPEFATIREEWIGLVKRLRLEQDKARNPNNASINHLKDKITISKKRCPNAGSPFARTWRRDSRNRIFRMQSKRLPRQSPLSNSQIKTLRISARRSRRCWRKRRSPIRAIAKSSGSRSYSKKKRLLRKN